MFRDASLSTTATTKFTVSEVPDLILPLFFNINQKIRNDFVTKIRLLFLDFRAFWSPNVDNNLFFLCVSFGSSLYQVDIVLYFVIIWLCFCDRL